MSQDFSGLPKAGCDPATDTKPPSQVLILGIFSSHLASRVTAEASSNHPKTSTGTSSQEKLQKPEEQYRGRFVNGHPVAYFTVNSVWAKSLFDKASSLPAESVHFLANVFITPLSLAGLQVVRDSNKTETSAISSGQSPGVVPCPLSVSNFCKWQLECQ